MEQIRDRILKLEQIEWRNLRDLQPPDLKHVANSDHIRQSILKNGFAFPFAVWQDPAGEIYAIDGHTRKDVLQEMDTVPETLPAFFIAAESREDAIRILLEVYNQRHNEINPVVLTEWLEVEAIAVETVNVGSLHSAEVKGARTEVTEDEYDDTLPEHPETVLGDLYEIGPHRLLCGDSTDSDQVARLMNGEKADMVFTDPPFPNNSEIMHDMIKNIDGAFNNSRLFCDKLMIWFWDNLEFPPFLEQVTSKHIWHKTNGWQAGHFETMYCYHNDEKRHEQKVYSVNNVGGDNNREEQGNHPTPKPISLIFEIINDLSKNSKLILDLFLGSGTTMLASHQLKRKCYGMELDPKYCQVIVERMKKLDPSLVIKKNGVEI